MEGKELNNLGLVSSPLSLSFLLCKMVTNRAIVKDSVRRSRNNNNGEQLRSLYKCLVLFSDLHTLSSPSPTHVAYLWVDSLCES